MPPFISLEIVRTFRENTASGYLPEHPWSQGMYTASDCSLAELWCIEVPLFCPMPAEGSGGNMAAMASNPQQSWRHCPNYAFWCYSILMRILHQVDCYHIIWSSANISVISWAYCMPLWQLSVPLFRACCPLCFDCCVCGGWLLILDGGGAPAPLACMLASGRDLYKCLCGWLLMLDREGGPLAD